MIAFLGLGRMGAPMAARLLAAGHQVTVWNRTPARAEPLATAGAAAAATPAAAAAAADIVITMLADRAALDAVAAQITPAMRSDACLIEMSTVGPSAVLELATKVPAVVDAPVMGSVNRAAAGTLTVLAGGDTGRVRDILATFGNVVACGELGAGAARKILLISAGIGNMVLAAELITLAERLGVADAPDILADGPLSQAITRSRATAADFPIRLAAKDIEIALDYAPDHARLPVLAAVRERLAGDPDQEADIRKLVG
jgi:3-hydroxyisobutyrate dehydrogenase-like beta-hydroxyacid dehydrogenase